MDVGRSREVQGVVGRVWVVEIIGFCDGFSLFLKRKVEQLEKAESKRVTADLYARNIDVLNKYGYDNLEKALEADKMLTS